MDTTGDGPLSVVVLVDCVGGGELEAVRHSLTGALETPTVLIRSTDLLSISISIDPCSGLFEVDGSQLWPAVVWIRHSSACAILARPPQPGSVRPLDASTWSGFLEHLATLTGAILPGSSPVGPAQLRDAARLGVSAPRTVITTDVPAGARRMGSPKVVVKSPDFRLFEPDQSAWPTLFPEIIDREVAASGGTGRGRPVVVQEYVPHATELRVYYLNGGICTFEVHKPDPSSLWTDPDSVSVARIDCPQAAAEAVREMCTAWDLRYAAFDLLVSPTGEPVFLEANPDGDWLWYERKARWRGVTFMAAVMVRELFVRAVRARTRDGS